MAETPVFADHSAARISGISGGCGLIVGGLRDELRDLRSARFVRPSSRLHARDYPFTLDPRRQEAHDPIDKGDGLDAPPVHFLLSEASIDPLCHILGAKLPWLDLDDVVRIGLRRRDRAADELVARYLDGEAHGKIKLKKGWVIGCGGAARVGRTAPCIHRPHPGQ